MKNKKTTFIYFLKKWSGLKERVGGRNVFFINIIKLNKQQLYTTN